LFTLKDGKKYSPDGYLKKSIKIFGKLTDVRVVISKKINHLREKNLQIQD
jgi:hypothetical protein